MNYYKCWKRQQLIANALSKELIKVTVAHAPGFSSVRNYRKYFVMGWHFAYVLLKYSVKLKSQVKT